MKTKLLLLEANLELQEILKHSLEAEDFELLVMSSRENLDKAIVEFKPEIILLDCDFEANWQSVVLRHESVLLVLLSCDYRLSAAYKNSIIKPITLPALLTKLRTIVAKNAHGKVLA